MSPKSDNFQTKSEMFAEYTLYNWKQLFINRELLKYGFYFLFSSYNLGRVNNVFFIFKFLIFICEAY